MPLEVRCFEPAMVGDIVAAYNRLTARAPLCYPITPEIFAESVTAKSAFHPEGFFVARLDGKCAGLIHAMEFEKAGRKEGSICLYVAEERGACRALLASAVAFLKERGAARCHVMGNAPGAQAFYAGLHTGYEVCLWRGYYQSVLALEHAGFELTCHGFLMSLALDREPEQVTPTIDVSLRVTRHPDAGSFYTKAVVEAFIGEEKVGNCGFYFLKRVSQHLGQGVGQITISVKEQYRRRRIASGLLSRAHRELWALGARRVVLATNYELYPAIQLYEKTGYRKEIVDFYIYTGYFDEQP